MSEPLHPRISFALDVIDKGIKLAAVCLGGIWTWWNYRKSRTYQQKLELEVAGSVFQKGNLYGDIKVNVKNIGAGVHPVQHEGTFCIVSVILRDLSESDLRLFRVFDGQARIEPGESLSDTKVWTIAAPFDEILWIRLTLRVVSNGLEWNTTCLVRADQEDSTDGG